MPPFARKVHFCVVTHSFPGSGRPRTALRGPALSPRRRWLPDTQQKESRAQTAGHKGVSHSWGWCQLTPCWPPPSLNHKIPTPGPCPGVTEQRGKAWARSH